VRYAVVNRRYQMIRSDLRQRAGPEVQQAAMQALRNDHVSLQQKLQEVTVLSINLSEFNHLAGQASPDRAQNIKDALERVLRTAALENGGTLLEVSGNTWAAVFNVPILQTDHPARAITAALQAHRQWEIERLALPDQDPARQIELPMGICIGRSLVGYALIREDGRASHQFQAMGEAVELAVQLCHFAASDQILLCGQGAESLEEENKIEVFSSWYVPGLKTSVLTYIVYPTE
jgi:class 3 adenylate cyclase